MSRDESITDRRQINSSCISSIGYSAIAQVLEIEFKSGAVYRYLAVPEDVHAKLIAADSKGAHLNRFIKPRFVCVRLKT